jgi:hypothetical protein
MVVIHRGESVYEIILFKDHTEISLYKIYKGEAVLDRTITITKDEYRHHINNNSV